jgi:hypothetical protein
MQCDTEERADVGRGTEVASKDKELSNACFDEEGEKANATVVDAAVDDGIGEVATITKFQ